MKLKMTICLYLLSQLLQASSQVKQKEKDWDDSLITWRQDTTKTGHPTFIGNVNLTFLAGIKTIHEYTTLASSDSAVCAHIDSTAAV